MRMEDYQIKSCKNYKTCHGTFCTTCLKKHFRNKIRKERIKWNIEWFCFICRGMCHCSKCQKELQDELLLLKQLYEQGIILL